MFSDGRLVADHDRVWARHQTLTNPVHLEAAKVRRRTRVGVLRPVRNSGPKPGTEPAVEQRPLADYDTALGIDLDLGGSDGGFAS